MSGDHSSHFTTSEQKVSWFAESSYHTYTFLTHYYYVLQYIRKINRVPLLYEDCSNVLCGT